MLARIKVEQAEIDFYVAVCRLNSAQRQNAFSRTDQARIARIDARQFQREISLDGGADIGRSLGINIEAAVGKLAAKNRLDRFADQVSGRWIPHAVLWWVHPQLQQNIVRFQG